MFHMFHNFHGHNLAGRDWLTHSTMYCIYFVNAAPLIAAALDQWPQYMLQLWL